MPTTQQSELNQQELRAIIEGYAQMVEERLDLNFEATLLTFMFNPLSRSQTAVTRQMQRAIETIYAKHLTHIHRHPHRQPLGALPFWISCPDWPVPKFDKDHFRDIAINDGQHSHALALTPPFRRMRDDLADHIRRDHDRYAGLGRPVARLHAKAITETPGKVVGYAMKSLGRRRAGLEDVIILPRTHSEM